MRQENARLQRQPRPDPDRAPQGAPGRLPGTSSPALARQRAVAESIHASPPLAAQRRHIHALRGEPPVQRVTRLQVQQGPSCWLYVLEAVVQSYGIGTDFLQMVMKSYPSSEDAVAERLRLQGQGRDIPKRAAALELIVTRMQDMIDRLEAWRIGPGGVRANEQISEAIVRRYANRALQSDRSVEQLEFGDDGTADVQGVQQSYQAAKARAQTLAGLAAQFAGEQDVGSLLQSGMQEIDGNQDQNDVHLSLQVQPVPSYVGINKRFKPTQLELANDPVDFTGRNLDTMEDSSHAILMDAYDSGGQRVTYKDPNYGNVRFIVSHVQFQAMAGDGSLQMRPFVRQQGQNQSRLAQVAD